VSLRYVHNLSLSRRSSFANSIIPMRNLQSAIDSLNRAERQLMNAVLQRGQARWDAIARFEQLNDDFEARFSNYEYQATHEQAMQELLSRYGLLERQSMRQRLALDQFKKSHADVKTKMDEVVHLLRTGNQAKAESTYREALPLFAQITSQTDVLMSLEVEDGEYLDKESDEIARAADRQIPVIASMAMALGFFLVLIVARSVERERKSESLQRAKDAAEAANRAKSDFLARMSHEVRTPMNGVMGAIDLSLQLEGRSEQREYLEMAKTSADALVQVIDDILDFSKIESGKLRFDSSISTSAKFFAMPSAY